MSSLYQWKGRHFKSIPKEIERKREQLDYLRTATDDASEAERIGLEKEMDELLYREEILWMQRSRIAWLREGDRNTKFFHRRASWRNKKNRIRKLKRPDGTWTSDTDEMECMATEFFQELYTRDENIDPSIITDLIQQCVDDDMNISLCAPFSDKEISDALFQIGPLKAPGPDGFPACFLQRNWGLLKEEVIHAVQNFFTDGVMPAGVNETTIVLIPKKDDPEALKDFRPISLCNVIFKVVSKCLVNRLRPLLEDIIAPVQSAFIPGRLITDNALIAFECIHAIQTGSAARRNFCAYKLDMAKAYDRVDWRFLEGVLAKLGFHSQWIQWVMACVTTVQYSIRFNGHMLDSFTPSRGIRQGDPLSPYLFLFVADGLSCLIRKEIENNSLREFHICRRAPGISHLLFADDSLLFFEASVEQTIVVKSVLDKYELSTGQMVSLGKCSIMYGDQCPANVQTEIRDILRYDTNCFEEKYLGLPVPEGRMMKGKFKSTKGKFSKHASDWSEKYMSSGAKEVLIKSVLQSISTYAMGVFKFPFGLIDDLQQII
jgi:hypothetical protein